MPVGKPDAGDQHVRFDERGRETEQAPRSIATAPVLDSTKKEAHRQRPLLMRFLLSKICKFVERALGRGSRLEALKAFCAQSILCASVWVRFLRVWLPPVRR